MCGIAGLLSRNNTPDVDVVSKMSYRLRHRGPDSSGIITSGPICLAHRRLSVIDTGKENDQPQYDSSNSIIIVFNGEIYNFMELRNKLERKGVIFNTMGDTEVILEAYKCWGIQCLNYFNGMFAFAIWDSLKNMLFISRDRLGEKPLFFSEIQNGDLIFASEPKAFFEHPQVDTSPDPIALAHYFTLNYTVGERNLMRGVRSLPPASYLIAQPEQPIVIQKYWDLAKHYRNKRQFSSDLEAAEQLNALLDDAVNLRLVSDVPLGAFLSGGIDSASIVSSMVRNTKADQVKTFSIGFNDKSFDETKEAQNVAAHFGVDHHEMIVTPDTINILEAIVAAADEPLADTSMLPMFHLAKFARQHVTVALGGDGSDECFVGYETYVADRLHNFIGRFPAPILKSTSWMLDHLLPVSFSKVSMDYKIRHFLAGVHFSHSRAHSSWRNIFSESERNDMMQKRWVDEIHSNKESDPFNIFAPYFNEVSDCHYIDQASYVDIKTWLPNDILVKVDRATMAHSLEARSPFLDHRLVEFAASLPVDMKLRGFKKKYLLKKSQQRHLPKWVINRRKQGFNAPISKWLIGPIRSFVGDHLNSSALHEWVRPEQIERLWRSHERKERDNGLKLFGLVCFSLWLNQS